MRVAIVGAGISGLAAARTLAASGHDPVVFESQSQVGGRILTVRAGGFLFDSGATTIAARGRELEDVMFRQLSTEGLVKIELPVFVHNSLRVSPGDPAKNRIDRFCYIGGNDLLPQRLAENLEVRLNEPVQSIERHGACFRIGAEGFDGVILAMPTEDAKPILATMGESRPFTNTSYRSCLAVLLGYDFEPPAVGYHALVDPDGAHPLGWLSMESLKCPGRAPDGKTAVLAQMGPQFSKLYFEAQDDYIAEATIDMLARLYNKNWERPEVAVIQRWPNSHPEMTAQFDSVNRPGSKVLVAGDGLLGARVEYAYECGARAARLLVETT